VALKDGTMGWELAGFECERGSERVARLPSSDGRALARAAADRVASRFQVKFTSEARLKDWQEDPQRTLYLLDVRTREEFEQAHLAGSRHAPGGQLVQATDEYVAVRNARVVLVDPERVRAVMTASWLNQMGWNEVYVLDEPGGLAMESGPRKAPAVERWRSVPAGELAGTVLDLSTSLRFRRAHIPGAWWGVRSRLEQARRAIGEVRSLVLTSEDSLVADLAAAEAAALWPGADVAVLAGGNGAWTKPMESGFERATTAPDDVAYKPYDYADYRRRAREYLDWEVALVEQIRRDPAIRFRTY
jgi:rhodanese-related sulfurtransferase